MTAEEYESLPKEVQIALDDFHYDEDPYLEGERIKRNLESIDWTCDYDLSGEIFDVQPLKNK